MSVSLYYEARRSKPITPQEQAACEEIARRYDTQYPYGELYEGFCIYNLAQERDESEQDIIISGATKLPSIDDMIILHVVNWWLKCLSEITDVLSGAQWHVHIDGGEIEWSENKRSFLPIDDFDDM